MSLVNAVGAAAAQAVATSGQAEQPPYPCAFPLTKVNFAASRSSTDGNQEGRLGDGLLSRCEVDRLEELLDRTFVSVKDLMQDTPVHLQSLPSAVEHRRKHSLSGKGEYRSPYAWYDVSFKDPNEKANYKTLSPDGAMDKKLFASENRMTLETMQHINGFHMTRATMRFADVTPEEFITEVHTVETPKRQRFTPGMKDYSRWLINPRLIPCAQLEEQQQKQQQESKAFAPAATYFDAEFSKTNEELENARLRLLAAAKEKVLAHNGSRESLSALRHWYVESNVYNAPPPVSCREALMAVEKLYSPEEDCFYLCGCSIDCNEHPSLAIKRSRQAKGGSLKSPAPSTAVDYEKCIRAVYMFGWRLANAEDGKSTQATMVSIMNPGGWTPSFVLSWFKSEVGREVAFMRKQLYTEVQECRRQQQHSRSRVPYPLLMPGSEKNIIDVLVREAGSPIGVQACNAQVSCSYGSVGETEGLSQDNFVSEVSTIDDGEDNDEQLATGANRRGKLAAKLSGCAHVIPFPAESLLGSGSTNSITNSSDGNDVAQDGDRESEEEHEEDANVCFILQTEDDRLVTGLEEEELVCFF